MGRTPIATPFYQGIDFLRAASVFLVLWSHGGPLLPQEQRIFLYSAFFRPGFWGVTIFFSISGFLIVGQLLDIASGTRQETLRTFVIRRCLRTMPTYWLLTLTLVVVGFLPWLPTADLIANLLFLQDFCRLPSLLPVAWSLVIEVWSYFLYALLAWASRAGSDFFQQGRRLLRFLPPGAAWLALALLLVPLLAGLIRWELASQGLSVQSLKQGLWPNLDALSYGGILAWFQRAGFSRFERLAAWRFLLPVCLLLMALLGATAPFLFADVGAGLPSDVRVWFAFGFYPCVGLLSCMLIISLWHFSYVWLPQWLAIACGALSRCSYSVYLVHLAVVAWLAPIGVGMPVFVLYILLSILVGSVSWRLLESPFSRLRYSFS